MRIARIVVQPLHEIWAFIRSISFPLMLENIIGDGTLRQDQSVEREPRTLRVL
jgi:hypothetical protein